MRSRSRRSTGDGQPEGVQDVDVIPERALAQVVDLIAIGVIDSVLVVVIAVGLFVTGTDPSPWMALPLLLLAPAYNVYYERRDGQTLGKRVFGIEVRSHLGDLTTRQVVLRNLPAAFVSGWAIYVIALIIMVEDDRNRRLFDVIAGTIVVRCADIDPESLPLSEYEFVRKLRRSAR